jgi:hypothetical protein
LRKEKQNKRETKEEHLRFELLAPRKNKGALCSDIHSERAGSYFMT